MLDHSSVGDSALACAVVERPSPSGHVCIVPGMSKYESPTDAAREPEPGERTGVFPGVYGAGPRSAHVLSVLPSRRPGIADDRSLAPSTRDIIFSSKRWPIASTRFVTVSSEADSPDSASEPSVVAV